MPPKKPLTTIHSYGIYSAWQSKSKDLPKIQKFTHDIPAEIDIEFGLTINIKRARGSKIHFTIEHPDILDENGQPRAPFTGEVHVTNNDWIFYLGDTIWAPIEDKCGDWTMSIRHKGQVIAEKTFHISTPENSASLNTRFTFV